MPRVRHADPVDGRPRPTGAPLPDTQSVEESLVNARDAFGRWIRQPFNVLDFWLRVDSSGGPDACWPWMGGRNNWGYGYVYVNGVMRRAHRVAWVLWHERPIPAGLYALHHCDNRPCCNPLEGHVYPGTQSENVKDEWRRFRKPARELALHLARSA